MCFSFKSRGSLRGLQPIIEPGWASLSKPLNRKMSPQEKQSNLTHSGNIIIYSGNAWQVIMPPPPWRGQLNAHRWEGGFLIVWHNFPSVQLLQVKGIWWSLSLTSLASVQYFCFLKLILSFLGRPPPPPSSPSGVDSVNHAWQELRSGVPLSLWGGGEAEVTCSLNKSLLTWRSNCGTCSYISLQSAGRTSCIHLWHLGPQHSLSERIMQTLAIIFQRMAHFNCKKKKKKKKK